MQIRNDINFNCSTGCYTQRIFIVSILFFASLLLIKIVSLSLPFLSLYLLPLHLRRLLFFFALIKLKLIKNVRTSTICVRIDKDG